MYISHTERFLPDCITALGFLIYIYLACIICLISYISRHIPYNIYISCLLVNILHLMRAHSYNHVIVCIAEPIKINFLQRLYIMYSFQAGLQRRFIMFTVYNYRNEKRFRNNNTSGEILPLVSGVVTLRHDLSYLALRQ